MVTSIKLLKYLETIVHILPAPTYWIGVNGVVLGGNEAILKGVGATSREDFVGKTMHDLYPKEIADHIKQFNEEIMQTGKTLSQEEAVKDITTGEIKYFTVIKAPLRDDNGKIIGLIGTAIDITMQRENAEHLVKKIKLLEDLNKIASLIPTPIYWEDVNSVIIGANESVIDEIGAQAIHDYVGKSLYEIYPKEIADHIKAHNDEVMRTGKTMSQEEKIVDKKGKVKYYAAVKAPLRDDDGNIIGIIGASVEITKQKELENAKLQEQKKFTKIANQVAHDIRSPLASLLMIVKSCTQIPETDRIALREAAIGIGDIANHLLNQYQKKEADDGGVTIEERQPIFISAILLQIIAEKKYQYQKAPVKFDCDFHQNTHFAFIKIEPSAFKRMVSNLINNAVDAFDNKPGKVNLKLEADNEWVKIFIQDDGKGMPTELVDKIMNRISVTAGKKSGYGIGLSQVWETLERNQGELSIDSKPGKGTIITVNFPRIRAPGWIAEEITLGRDDRVIILDDDTSIHGAWRARFEPILSEAPNIRLEHFQIGKEALEFMDALPDGEKQKIFLLSDYELLKQELNGLHVVARSKVKRSILVTSHYANLLVQEQAAKTGTKILPKQLASEIPIEILEATQGSEAVPVISAVIVDDDESFVQSLLLFVLNPQTTDKYHSPEHFLNNVHKYAKDTKMYLDNNYALSSVKGLEIAEKLYKQGYRRLYLLSGEVFKKEDIPPYLTLIRKDDIDSIRNL